MIGQQAKQRLREQVKNQSKTQEPEPEDDIAERSLEPVDRYDDDWFITVIGECNNHFAISDFNLQD